MQEFHFLISEECENERLDKALSELTDDTVSRSYLQKLIKDNQIYVNDKPQKASYKLKVDDYISFMISVIFSFASAIMASTSLPQTSNASALTK